MAPVASILLIEDDADIRRLVATTLADHGHQVESVVTAMAGLEMAVKSAPDLVILDLGLPDLDGDEMLKMLRSVSDVPVIVATARGDEEQILRTFDAGADDYLVKPFSARQLEARIRAILRRGGATQPDDGPLEIGDLVVDPKTREVRLQGEAVDLSPKEFDLLLYLAEHEGEVVGKRQLMAAVWREPYGGSDRTVDVHLSAVRKKLGESAASPRFLRTVHGVGVKLVAP